ncbi:MAG: erythromycin biosynthesis sensory transduction protein eryC1 [Verrucomicrobia bacterium]|nr:MAG: erythromycin biosynthesis sensory transduction protein eryC1 [Verrucomicrobiota bacterium]
MKKIPLSRVFLSEEVRKAALRALNSGSYILAKECEAFEAELAHYIGTKHAVLCSSWTAGGFLLHRAMGLKGGDEILVPSHTAFPSIEPMIHFGAKPVFIDIDETYCLDVDLLEASITPRTVGILPVHLYGHPANLDRVFEIARKHDLWVIEDCAQAHGARFKGKCVGSMGVAGAFSFYPSKNLTVMGDGGCITTNDSALADDLRMLRNHGRKSKYIHDVVGYNYRFNEIQAAIGRVELRDIDKLNEHRRRVAARYTERIDSVVKTPPEKEWAHAVYHMYVIRTERRDELAKHLQSKGIGTGIHYPVANHQQPAVTKLYPHLPKLPRTEAVVKEILSMPIYGELPLEDVDYVCDAILEFFGKQ